MYLQELLQFSMFWTNRAFFLWLKFFWICKMHSSFNECTDYII